MVPKRSTDGKPKFRFCVDFRALNQVTKFDAYPLPVLEETSATLHGSKYFSVLDCYSGFWQINIKEEHKERTGFAVPSGHYEFNKLPFCLANSPSSFLRLMDVVLKNLIVEECWIYLDDVIIFSKTAQEHAQRLINVLQRFDKANLQLQPKKCEFAKPQVQYLGFILSERGVGASPEKVKAAQSYPTPKSVRDVRAFLGLACFYRRLVKGFADTAKPLIELTKKDRALIWGPDQQKAFDDLKNKLCNTPVLAFPNFNLPFILTTDASKLGLAAILSQMQNGEERPVAYASRQMNRAESSYSASEAELLALVWATKKFRCYLYGKHFLVRTDHLALTYLKNFADNNSRLIRWALRLSDFYFSIQLKPGSRISHVDALSRHVGAVMEDDLPDKDRFVEEQRKYPYCSMLKPGKHTGKADFFLDDDGVVYKRRTNYKHQLVVPASLVQNVIRTNHNTVFVAHPGIKRTF